MGTPNLNSLPITDLSTLRILLYFLRKQPSQYRLRKLALLYGEQSHLLTSHLIDLGGTLQATVAPNSPPAVHIQQSAWGRGWLVHRVGLRMRNIGCVLELRRGSVTKNLDQGKKWTPGPIFACQKWTGLTKSGPGLSMRLHA